MSEQSLVLDALFPTNVNETSTDKTSPKADSQPVKDWKCMWDGCYEQTDRRVSVFFCAEHEAECQRLDEENPLWRCE